MTAQENYDKLRTFLRHFPHDVKSKKDLLKIKDKKLLKDYYKYKIYFKIDGRLKPENVIKELKRYRKTCLKFKSEELGFDLSKKDFFDEHDKYKSSRKLVAQVTDAMLGKDIKLTKLRYDYKTFDISYGKKVVRKVVTFRTQNRNLEFMENLEDDIYINLRNAEGGYNSAYNKNGLDFIYDYHNQSNDFAQNLAPLIEDSDLYIYRY